MKPAIEFTAPSQRPTDPIFAFFVVFYNPKAKRNESSVRAMWTDSREYAEQFAAGLHLYARPCVVKERAEWAANRRLGLTEAAPGVVR